MKFHTRGFTSLALSLGSLVLGISGIVLYFAPKGRVAYWTNWTMLSIEKDTWQAIHINMALFFLLLSAFHLYLNWALFWGYLKTKSRWAMNLKAELAAAVLLTIVFVGGSMLLAPPFGTIIDLKTQVENRWERQAPKAPAPHADEFTFTRLSQSIDLSVDQIRAALSAEGYAAKQENPTLRQIADQHGVAPSDVFAAIAKRHPEVEKRRGGKGK